MKKFLKIFGIGCGGVVVFFVLAIAIGFWVLHSKQTKYDEIAIPWIASIMKDLNDWDATKVDPYWAPEIRKQFSEEELSKLFSMYSRLGTIDSYQEPEFLKIESYTGFPYPSLVTYQVTGEFEHGPAILTFKLVPTGEKGLFLWGLHINSNVFLVPLEEESSPQPTV